MVRIIRLTAARTNLHKGAPLPRASGDLGHECRRVPLVQLYVEPANAPPRDRQGRCAGKGATEPEISSSRRVISVCSDDFLRTHKRQ